MDTTMGVRDAAHYRRMMRDNPNASVGFTLAAKAICTARPSLCYDTYALWLRKWYGESISSRCVLSLMSKR